MSHFPGLKLAALSLLLALFAGVGVLLAQSDRGTITRTVLDSSGAAVPNAKVTATKRRNGSQHFSGYGKRWELYDTSPARGNLQCDDEAIWL